MMSIPHRNELINPKILGPAEQLNRLWVKDRLDLVGNGWFLVDRSMLRARVTVDSERHHAAEKVLDRDLFQAIEQRALGSWGFAYAATDRARYWPPTWNHDKKRWEPQESGVFFAPPDEDAEPATSIAISAHFVEALWPWLSRSGDYEFRALEPLGPAVLCDRRIAGSYLRATDAPKERPCYPVAIVMPMRI